MLARGGAVRAVLVAVLALVVLPAATSDVIFRVPEVLVNKILVRAAGAGRGAVGTGAANSSRSADDGAVYEVRYEEYFVEHDVSTAFARNAAAALNLDHVPASRAGCGACSPREMEYCETRVLADHCCCERAFVPEPFPWLPHTCYMGPSRCRPLAHDCVRYARLRDCCCYRKLAEKWKGILSKSSRVGVNGGVWLVVLSSAVLVLAVLL